ncbi:GMC oxidoreductase [Cryptosporangium sp. NPDC048952]|uniref:GMC oxidoreductase n=1 Tax=Cryptosporangium sp. NPDC048952 TaxID=3363961 RepID=UPI00371CB39C
MYFDVAVIGAGAVGISVARHLADSGISVGLLEAGNGDTENPREVIAHTVTNLGRHHQGVRQGWAVGPGGTTQLWGGQLWAWEDYEFRSRSYLRSSEWPISSQDLRHYNEAFLHGIGAHPRIEDLLLGPTSSFENNPRLGPAYVKHSAWLPWRKRNFFRSGRHSLRRDARLKLLVGERVVGLEELGSERLTVALRSVSGVESRLTCRMLIMAAGTLGNIRLIQRSGASQSPWLGRGFMDHVGGRYASFDVFDARRFMRSAGAKYVGTSLLTPRMVMHPEVAAKNELLNSFAHWAVALPAESGLYALREMLRAVQRRDPHARSLRLLPRAIGGGTKEAVDAAYAMTALRRRPVPAGAKVHLQVDVEQPPRYESSVQWVRSGDSESLQVSWDIGAEERRSFDWLGSALLESLDLASLGLTNAAVESDPHLGDTYHMMGGTRISQRIADGVVDNRQRIHGLANVMVAGASVFPTGGVANPTMTAAALALRAASTVIEEI